MDTRVKLCISIAVLVLVGLGITVMRLSSRRREANYQSVLAMYSRDLYQGETRDEVKRYVELHGAQPENDVEPDTSTSHDMLVQLGKEPSPLYCSRKITYLGLKFNDADKYYAAAIKTELQDCM